MRLLTPFSIIALVAGALADVGPSDVISLTNADFDSVVNSEALILVEFFAPW
jgi:protein disulfide-isomerase A1